MNAWFLKILMWFFFLKMMVAFFWENEPWANAPSIQKDAWFLEIFMMIFSSLLFFKKKLWWFFFWKRMRRGRMPLVWNINPWVLRKLELITLWEQWCRWWFFENKCVRLVRMSQLDLKKKTFWVSNDRKKNYTRTSNCMNVGLRGCVPFGN